MLILFRRFRIGCYRSSGRSVIKVPKALTAIIIIIILVTFSNRLIEITKTRVIIFCGFWIVEIAEAAIRFRFLTCGRGLGIKGAKAALAALLRAYGRFWWFVKCAEATIIF